MAKRCSSERLPPETKGVLSSVSRSWGKMQPPFCLALQFVRREDMQDWECGSVGESLGRMYFVGGVLVSNDTC